MAVLITLEQPTKVMRSEAKKVGQYHHKMMGRSYDRISIVTIEEIVEKGKRLELPISLEVIKTAEKAPRPRPKGLFDDLPR